MKDVVVKSRLRDGPARHRILRKIVIVSLPESVIVVFVVDEFLISSRCKQSWSLGTCITHMNVYTCMCVCVCTCIHTRACVPYTQRVCNENCFRTRIIIHLLLQTAAFACGFLCIFFPPFNWCENRGCMCMCYPQIYSIINHCRKSVAYIIRYRKEREYIVCFGN